MSLLIGSRAIAFWNDSFKAKPEADWDVIGDPYDKDYGKKVEWHPRNKLNNCKAEELFATGVYYEGFNVCSPLGLMLIYRSHLHRERKFDSNITKYHKFILPIAVGYGISLEEQNFLEERIQLTKREYPQGYPKLNQKNEDFFDDAVDKVYDHDWLHELYAYYQRPLYESLKPKSGRDMAWCERDLWRRLSLDDKCKCVSEECYVIATERFLVTSDWTTPPKLAYIKALQKVCTTLTSGWFRDFAIDNYPQILNLFDSNKIKGVKEKIDEV